MTTQAAIGQFRIPPFLLTLSVVSLTVPMLAFAARTRIHQSTSIKEEPCHL